MKTVYLALGTNLGDREKNLQRALDRMSAAGVYPIQISSVYETKPMYLPDQAMFYNMVAIARTEKMPRLLLRKLQGIEREMGRRRGVKNGPRTIDIDILFFGSVIMSVQELIIPHPRIEERGFVLEPLAELSPDLRHPVSRRAMRDILAALPVQGVRKIATKVHLPESGITSSEAGST